MYHTVPYCHSCSQAGIVAQTPTLNAKVLKKKNKATRIPTPRIAPEREGSKACALATPSPHLHSIHVKMPNFNQMHEKKSNRVLRLIAVVSVSFIV